MAGQDGFARGPEAVLNHVDPGAALLRGRDLNRYKSNYNIKAGHVRTVIYSD